MATVNLKLQKEKHEMFLRIVRENGETMQSILSAFVTSYINNPKIFIIKMEVSINGSDNG